MTRKLVTAVLTIAAGLLALAPPAAACGFLIAENGAVRLVRTTTFVAWDGEVERYITNFEFAGEQESFGSIIPLPGEPTHVGKAGGWTLQRLDREVRPPAPVALSAESADQATYARGVDVLLETTVDSLDITVVRGGGAEVADWADEQGFDLGEGSAELLNAYSDRSPYFMAARFDASSAVADGLTSGDGIPVLIEVPVERPWVPIHILGFDLPDQAPVVADVFLLTPDEPDLLHGAGLTTNVSEPANDLLLDDLRSDENMEWVPYEGWFTHLELDATAGQLQYDLSVGADGVDPSAYEAGLTRFDLTAEQLASFGIERSGASDGPSWWLVGGLAGLLGVTGGVVAATTVVATRSRTS